MRYTYIYISYFLLWIYLASFSLLAFFPVFIFLFLFIFPPLGGGVTHSVSILCVLTQATFENVRHTVKASPFPAASLQDFRLVTPSPLTGHRRVFQLWPLSTPTPRRTVTGEWVLWATPKVSVCSPSLLCSLRYPPREVSRWGQTVPDSGWFHGRFSDVATVWEQHAFSRNHTLKVEFRDFPRTSSISHALISSSQPLSYGRCTDGHIFTMPARLGQFLLLVHVRIPSVFLA